jgi:Rhodopirellula transposase DDE domain
VDKIEHRLFSYISQNWRGKPLRSFETIVSLIAGTTTSTGLKVHAELNTDSYPSGLTVSDQELAQTEIRRDNFHGDWNYEIQPETPSPDPVISRQILRNIFFSPGRTIDRILSNRRASSL